jgi:hypothetical protein
MRKKLKCLDRCVCLALILVPIVSYCAPGTLNRVWAKTQALDTKVDEIEVLTLSTSTPIKIEAGSKQVKVYNISFNITRNLLGLYLVLINPTHDVQAYFCSGSKGVRNASSLCGSFYYQEV